MTITITMATSAGSPVHEAPAVVRADCWETNAPCGLEPGEERFVEAAAAAGASLPGDVLRALDGLVDGAPQAGALLVRGLPVGPLPPTPASPRRLIDKDRTSELVLLAVARRLGEPVGFEPEHGGDLVQNIVPTAAAAARQTSTSSRWS